MKNKKLYIITAIALVLGLTLGYMANSSSNQTSKVGDAQTESAAMETIWTCAMHPQVQLKEPGQCPICGMDLIPLIGSKGESGGANPNAISFNEGQIQQHNIQVVEIGESSTEKVIRLDGKVKVNENNSVIQSAHYGGRIEDLYVQHEGQLIQKGSLIAKIYSPELIKAQKELLETVKLKAENPMLYAAAKKKLNSWKISKTQIQEIEKENKVIEFLPIYAENTGIVTLLNVELGDYVKKGQKLIQLADLSSVWVELDAFERDLQWLKKGQEVSLKINTGKQAGYKGVISYIDPIINAKSRTAKVRVVIQNGGELKPEMFVSGTIEIANSLDEVVVIPKSAVLWTGQRSVYYKEVARHTFSMREVVLGKDLGGHYQVLKGLDKGDRIVKTGTFVVDASAQLQGKPSMMNKPKGIEQKGEIGQSSKSNDVVLNLYLSATKLLQQDKEEEVKIALGKILNAVPSLKEAYPHILHHSNDQFKQSFSDFSLSFNKEYQSAQKTYLIRCPMANSDKGGYWISVKPEVDNPYFGGDMKACGSIQNN
ncbi:MAG: Cu(I)/Ag(I) efflux system membrane fusion protein [Glaciecola sp.]|jgi:Cu(I)/Ag(I) efflux system membrane fusion protein